MTVKEKIPAAGNSTSEKNYLFTDNNPVQNGYYRIAQYDIGGRVTYTSMLRASCNNTDVFKVWPNPFIDKIFMNITASSLSQATIKMFDSKGALVKKQTAILLNGNNLLNVEIKGLAGGAYHLSVEWDNGQIKKVAQIIKQ